MPASVPSFSDHSTFAPSAERYASRLLLWVHDQARGRQETPVSCAGFGLSQSIPVSVVEPIVERLSAQGLIRAHDAGGLAAGGGAPVVSLLASGVTQARRLQSLRSDAAERGRHARKAVLHWISAQTDRRPLRINGFFDSPDCFFLGSALTGAEVAECLRYLSRSGLITCEGPPFHDEVGSHVALTPEGVDVVLTGADIDGYVARRRERERELVHAKPPQHNNVQATNVSIAGGDSHTTVNSTVEVHATFTPAEVMWLVARLAPELHLDADSRAALLRTAAQWAPTAGAGDGDDPDGGDPDGGDPGDDPEHGRGLLRRMRDHLGAAPDSMGQQLLLNAVDQVAGRLLGG